MKLSNGLSVASYVNAPCLYFGQFSCLRNPGFINFYYLLCNFSLRYHSSFFHFLTALPLSMSYSSYSNTNTPGSLGSFVSIFCVLWFDCFMNIIFSLRKCISYVYIETSLHIMDISLCI